MMRLQYLADQLRRDVEAQCGKWPTWVSIEFVHSLFGRRIDVSLRWVVEPNPYCIIHTDARTARQALKIARVVAPHIRPGIRFRAADPSNSEPLRRL